MYGLLWGEGQLPFSVCWWFDPLAHVRQVPVTATWISEVSYNPNAALEELFPQCTPICPSSWSLAWGSHQIRGWGYQISGSWPSGSELSQLIHMDFLDQTGRKSPCAKFLPKRHYFTLLYWDIPLVTFPRYCGGYRSLWSLPNATGQSLRS